MSHETFHLSDERLQALLDGQLPEGDAARAREHLAACVRCETRMETWRGLYAELDGLPALTPSAGFAERVLGELPVLQDVPSLPARLLARLRQGRSAAAPAHPAPGRLQDLLDGRVGGRRAAALEAHVAACASCRREVEGLARVVSSLERLPRFAPSEAFADRVMAAVRVPEPAPALVRMRRRAVARVREVLSLRTRRAWAALAGMAVPPAVVAAMVAWVVFSHPLVTPGSLASFLWLQGADAVGLLTAWLSGAGTLTGLLAQTRSALETLSMAAAATGFVAFSALTVVAVWVLYTNLASPPAAEHRYAEYQA